MQACMLCPRKCGADRDVGAGFCGVGSEIRVAKIMLHKWEEPCICRGAGAGAIFFSGCNLHCLYCQNCKISGGEYGEIFTEDDLVREIISLSEQGASCIDLVTPTHFTDKLAFVLERVKPSINIPIVWNSSGYEDVSTLKSLDGLVDIYMPDLKYYSSEISKKYSHAEDYFMVATEAIKEMIDQVGKPNFNGDGKLLSGVIVRHLVLPDCRRDSMALLDELSSNLPSEDSVVLSLMSQYTPDFYLASPPDGKHKNLARRLTSFEYNSVLRHAQTLGFEGYFQNPSSASADYTPEF